MFDPTTCYGMHLAPISAIAIETDSTSGASAHDLGWPSGFSRFSSLHPPGAEELHSNVENGTEGAT
jgi:hypothetical protein